MSNGRTRLMLPLANFIPTLPGLAGLAGSLRAYAPSPCWRDSTTQPVKWQPVPKKIAVKLYHRARDFERRTRRPGKQDGALGRNGLAVLHALIFDCLNYATGRLDPAIATIARLAAISERSAARGLAALKFAGVLNWLRRCTASIEDGRFTLRQDSNAYAILPATQWRGYSPPAEPPAPERGTWGDHPPLPDAVTAAAAELRESGSLRGALRELENDPGDVLAKALARLGRAFEARKTASSSGLPV
jgi:hypothetical protein